MNYNDKVYVISKKVFGLFKGDTISSGFCMSEIELSDSKRNLYYTNDILNVKTEFSNSEIWKLIDDNAISEGIIIKDKYNTEYILLDGQIGRYNKGIADGFLMTKGDKWTIDRIHE